MKLHVLILSFLLVSLGVLGQTDKYLSVMESSIDELYQTNQLKDFDPIINKFKRIGEAEAESWEPLYYAALGHVFKAFRLDNPQERDLSLNASLTLLTNASDRSPNNVEIILLEGFTNMIKIGVDPATRGQMLTPMIMASYQRAMQMDPANPRAALFMAQMQMGTAEFFGSGIAESCQLVDHAVKLYNQYERTSVIQPSWGKETAIELQKQCSEKAEAKEGK
jgi:hypothetical protein